MKRMVVIAWGLALVVAAAAWAGMPPWQNLNGPPNVKVTGLAVGNDQLGVEWVYAADDIGVFHRSNNGGLSWEPVWHPYASTPRCVATPLNNAEEVWIGRYGQGVSLSFNSGLSWYLRNVGLDNLNVQCLTIVPSNRAWAYAGCFREEVGQITLYRTTNWGETWSPTQTPLTHHVQAVVVNPTDALKLYAATQDYVYKTTDGGVSWTRCVWGDDGNTFSLAIDFESGPQPILYAGSTVYTPFPIPTTDAVIYKSTNDGQSWSLAKNISMGLKTTGLALAPGTGGRVIYATTEARGVYVSEDWGATWGPKNQGIVDLSLWCVGPDPDPAHLGVVYVGTENTVYRSTDFGDSWQESNYGMNAGNVLYITTRGSDIYTSFRNVRKCFTKSSNSGTSWNTVFAPPPPTGHQATDIEITPQVPTRIFGILDHVPTAQIMRSTNGGETWLECLVTGAGQPIHTNRVVAGVDQPLKVFVGAYVPNPKTAEPPYVWNTEDGGDSWTRYQIGTQPAFLDALAPDPANSQIVYAGGWWHTYGALWASEDGGKTWAERNNGVNPDDRTRGLAVSPLHSTDLFACGSYGVYASRNSGWTWTPASEGLTYPDGQALVQDPVEPEVLYVATQDASGLGHVYVSVDGAAQWTEVSGGLPGVDYFTDLAMDRIDSGPVYAATAKGAYSLTPTWQFKSMTSASSEASDYNSQRKLVRQEWTNTLHAVYHSGGSGGHHVYYTVSTDGGGSWSPKMLLGQGQHPAIALDGMGNPHVVYLSDDEHTIFYVGRPWGAPWTSPFPLYAPGTAYALGAPALVMAPGATEFDFGHVIFHQESPDPYAQYSIVYGVFDPFNPAPIQPVTVDGPTGSPCLRPSLSRHIWSNTLHAVWLKGNDVFYSSRAIYGGNWETPYAIYTSTFPTLDASVEVYGDNVHAVWVGTPLCGEKVYYRYRDVNLPPQIWFPREEVTPLCNGDRASPQTAAGDYCFWAEQVLGNWEIFWSHREWFGWSTPNPLSGTPQRSVAPQVSFAPWMMGTRLFCFWTEDDAAPFQEYFAWFEGALSPFFIADAGLEQPSSYTVHRGGYMQFAPRPEKTVDTDGSYLSYRFRHLNPRKLYLVRASYYQETGSPTGLEVKVDGATFANVMVPNRSVIRGEAWVPSELYADSVVEFVIRKKSGTLGTLGYLELCQAEPKGKGGPQSSGLADLSLPKEFSLGAGYPNPMTSESRIAYALPKASSVDLTVYNVSGQVVKRLKSESNQAPGRYSVRWDGRNESGHRVPGGVYFYRLSAGSFVETKKMVVVR